jgi:SulP family sulfate permease
LPALVAGLVVGSSSIFYHISLAALIFSGELSPFVSDGIGLILFGSAVLGIVVAVFSSLPGMMAAVQDSPAAIFAVVTAAMVVQMPEAASPQQVYFTVVAALSLTSILTGLLFFLLGRFHLSSFVRFVPYPVVGGFLAGTGWLLVKGALRVMTDLPLHMSDVPSLFRLEMLVRWLPGALFAVALILLTRRFRSPLLMPSLLVAAVALFYVVLLVSGVPFAEASARGLLLGPFPEKALWSPLQLSALALVDWQVVWGQAGRLASIMVLSTIGLLLNASGLELAIRKDIDLDRELVAAGVGNVLAGLGGSPVGFQTIGTSTLSQRMAGGSRLTTVITALLLAGALFFGASVLSFFPKVVLGGLLLFLALSFLVEWVFEAARTLPRMDYLLVLVILVIIATVGFLEGVGAGTVIAVILFAVNYSRVDYVKDTLTGLIFRSRMDRPEEHRRLLDEKGDQIFILRLQGFLFFGTAQNLLNRLRLRLRDESQPRLRFVLLDFHNVTALDSSAVMSFSRMQQLAQSNQVQLVLCEVGPQMRTRLERGGLVENDESYYRLYPSLDHGMEWCEGRLLAEDQRSMIVKAASLERQLRSVFTEAGQSERFMGYLERLEIEKGRELINQGAPSDAMYFVDSGRVSALLEIEPGKFIRLRSMGGGTVVGEVGMYLKQARIASIFTDVPSVVYRLSEASLAQMETENPGLSAALHQWMVRLLAQRLTDNNRTLEALLN